METLSDSARESGEELRWMRLDNMAKIYPAAKRKDWSNVFRLSAWLTETVDGATLQTALNAILPRFPSIAVRLRRGMFWYYLEELPEPPEVKADGSDPLTHIEFSDIRKCAFRVVYCRNRISVEFFHALTDGNGGIIFLKTLLAEYIEQKYAVPVPCEHGVLDRREAPKPEELEDSFPKYTNDVSHSRWEEDAFHMSGTTELDNFHHLIVGTLDVKEALALARSYGVTLTVLLASVMISSIVSIQNEQIPRRSRQKPVKVLIPVNLRKLFGSSSLRNFVLNISPGIDPRLGDYSFEEILQIVHHQMAMEITSKQMSSRIEANVRFEQPLIVKLMPLFIKNTAMKMVYDQIAERKTCITLSNLGEVKVPDVMRQYVEKFHFILSVQATTPNNCGVASYNGKLYISFIRKIRESTLERNFFTTLHKLGLHVCVESNQRSRNGPWYTV